MTGVGVALAAGTFAFLRWRLRNAGRRVTVTNHEDYFYEIRIEHYALSSTVTVPCQHLPWLISFLERMSPKHAVGLGFKSNAGPTYDNSLIVPPWANRKLLRQLRRLRKTWQPRWTNQPRLGPYR